MTAFEWEQENFGGSAQESQWEDARGASGEVYELEQSEELELATELLEISSEEELEQFLGDLVKKVARGASALIKSPIGSALGGVLKNVAKTALPMVGSALGSFVAPGIGTAIGGKLGSMASNLLEAEELERLDESEAELEAARRYVRWASGTIRNTMRSPRGVPPRVAVRSAAVSSARRYAPALLRDSGGRRQRVASWRRRRGPAWGVPAWGGPVWAGAWSPYGPQQPDQDGWGQDGWSQGAGDQGGWSQGAGDQGGWDQGAGDPGAGDPRAGGWSGEGETFESYEAPAGTAGPAPAGPRHSGTWTRRGHRIVVHDV